MVKMQGDVFGRVTDSRTLLGALAAHAVTRAA